MASPLDYLIVAAYDSMNQPLAALVAELLHEGNSATVVVNNASDAANLEAFRRRGVEPVEVSRYDFSSLDSVDVVVMAPVRPYGMAKLIEAIRERDLFIVSFANLFSSIVMREYPDLVLALGEAKFGEFAENGFSYNMVAVGNPQYDCLVEARHARGRPIEKVLVVDQGGYPYGERGKRELAEAVGGFARANPEMRFDVKPRFYASLAGRQTHEQTAGFLGFLDDRPENLRCLEEPAQLEELVQGYDAMITMWSTAYLDAALLDIPLILVGGLDSDDVFDVRSQRVEEAYRHLEGTGCLRDRHELAEGTAEFSYVETEYLDREVYGWESPSGERTIRCIEAAWETCAEPGERWSRPFAMGADEFLEQAPSLPRESLGEPRAKARHSYLVELNREVQEWSYVNRCLERPFDMEPFRACYEEDFSDVEDGDFEGAAERKLSSAKAAWDEGYDGRFRREETAGRAREDAVLQDYYFDWLSGEGRSAEIESFDGPVLASSSRAYNLALAELERGDTEAAFARLQEFLDAVSFPDDAQLRKRRHAIQLLLPFAKKAGAKRFAGFALHDGNFKKLSALAEQAFGVASLRELVSYVLRMRGNLF